MNTANSTTVIDCLRLHGNLNYAAAVAPYGRPFLASLTKACAGRSMAEKVIITKDMRLCLQIWKSILTVNRGVTFAFLTDALPRSKNDVFVDASSSWGIGGICGSAFFRYSWDELAMVQPDIIARMELLGCLVALICFSDILSGKIVRFYCDNENAVAWLRKGRSNNPLGNKFLAYWEFLKFTRECKISPTWLPSFHNCTADALSRGRTPRWLRRYGIRKKFDVRELQRGLKDTFRLRNTLL